MVEKQQASLGERGAIIQQLVGPGGAGKSTVGALLAEQLAVAFIDLDRRFSAASETSARSLRGTDMTCMRERMSRCTAAVARNCVGVVALSSGFMTYDHGVHPECLHVRRELEQGAQMFVLLPCLDRERCVAKPFASSRATIREVSGERRGRYTSTVRNLHGPSGSKS
jgi:shikimate kinase